MIIYQHNGVHFSKNAVFSLELSSSPSHLHWHNAIEFIYILDGKLKINLDGVSFIAEEGEIVSVNSGVVHSFTSCGDEVKYYFFIVDDSFLRANSLYSKDTVFEPVLRSAEVRRIFDKIIGEHERADEYSNVSTLSLLMSLFVYMNRYHSSGATELRRTEKKRVTMVRRALAYLDEHYREHLSVSDVALALHFSESYLCHSFRSVTNYSIVEYINLLRCYHARVMILEGSSVGCAAEECGFSDVSYFSKVFKKSMGILPSEVSQDVFTLSAAMPKG